MTALTTASAPGTERMARLRQGMREQQVDALVCMKPQSAFYLSGFNPILFSHPVVAILPLEGELTILVHALRDDHARQSAWASDIRLFGAWSTKKSMGPDWLAALQSILEEKGVLTGTLGVDGDFLPLERLRQFEQRFARARLKDASGLIMRARMVKDPAEIEAMRASCRLADTGMQAALGVVGAGKTERQVAVEAMVAMNRAWASGYPEHEVGSFGSLEGGVHNALWSFCLAGDHILVNADNPSHRVIAEGEIAWTFVGAACSGMHSENERSVAIGKLSDEKRRAFDAVLEINQVLYPAVRPGVSFADLFGVAKRAYERLGYGVYLPGRIGHGIGLGPHEEPSISPREELLLEPGMIVTIEPNLRIPEWGGLQHSDTVLITDAGFDFLTTTERGLIQQ